MKKLLLALSIVAIANTSVFAQVKHEKKINPSKSEKNKVSGKTKHHKSAMANLNLSEAQRNEARSIRKEYYQKIKNLEDNKSITLQDYRAKKSALRNEEKMQFMKLLSEEQKELLAKGGGERNRKGYGRSKENGKMMDNLNLSSEQASQLKNQREEFNKQAEEIKQNQSFTQDQRKQQLMELRKSQKEAKRKY
jgi:ribosome recycling factor